jgi:hypothetical protein
MLKGATSLDFCPGFSIAMGARYQQDGTQVSGNSERTRRWQLIEEHLVNLVRVTPPDMREALPKQPRRRFFHRK